MFSYSFSIEYNYQRFLMGLSNYRKNQRALFQTLDYWRLKLKTIRLAILCCLFMHLFTLLSIFVGDCRKLRSNNAIGTRNDDYKKVHYSNRAIATRDDGCRKLRSNSSIANWNGGLPALAGSSAAGAGAARRARVAHRYPRAPPEDWHISRCANCASPLLSWPHVRTRMSPLLR